MPILVPVELLRLQCKYCEAKSDPVKDKDAITPAEHEMLEAFKDVHQLCEIRALGLGKDCGPFGSKKAEPISVRRPHGREEWTGPYGERQTVDTIQCPHCQSHVPMRKGVQLGWCELCARQTCGRPGCVECVPAGQRLDNLGKGLPDLTPRPLKILVPEWINNGSEEVPAEAEGSDRNARVQGEGAAEPVLPDSC